MARRRRKDWISILKRHRNLETNSVVLRDADGVDDMFAYLFAKQRAAVAA